MATNKAGMALYEAIRRTNTTRRSAEQPQGGQPDSATGALAIADPLVDPPGPAAPALPAVFAPQGAGHEFTWGTREGRVWVSLTSRSAALAIFGLVVVLASAFQIGRSIGGGKGSVVGRRAAEAADSDELLQARESSPVAGLFEGLGVSPVGTETDPQAGADPTTDAASPPAGDATQEPSQPWVKGYSYVVVQDFRADARPDAERAARFLHDNGVEAAILQMTGDWKYRLIAVQGFDRDDPQQKQAADVFLARIKKLGQTFFEAGGRYRLEGYFKKLTADRW